MTMGIFKLIITTVAAFLLLTVPASMAAPTHQVRVAREDFNPTELLYHGLYSYSYYLIHVNVS